MWKLKPWVSGALTYLLTKTWMFETFYIFQITLKCTTENWDRDPGVQCSSNSVSIFILKSYVLYTVKYIIGIIGIINTYCTIQYRMAVFPMHRPWKCCSIAEMKQQRSQINCVLTWLLHLQSFSAVMKLLSLRKSWDCETFAIFCYELSWKLTYNLR